jgi:predicted DNA-binding transcriptional regulator AlpA
MSNTAQTNRTTHIRISTNSVYVTTGQVRERFSCSDMWIYRHIRDHGFPQPIRFGGRTSARRWRVADIEAWEKAWEAAQT